MRAMRNPVVRAIFCCCWRAMPRGNRWRMTHRSNERSWSDEATRECSGSVQVERNNTDQLHQ
jgi:hypothetical protein